MPVGSLIEELRRLTGQVTPEQLEAQGRERVTDASRTFAGQQRALIGVADQAGLQEAVTRSQEQAGTSFDVAEGVLERRQRGLGIQLTERQRRAQTRRLGLGRAVAEAGAGSAVRRNFRRRATAAATAAGGLETSLRDIEAAGLEGLANAAGQAKIRREQERAARKSARLGMFSTFASIAVAAASSETFKHDKRPVIETEGSLLERIRVEKWKYLGETTDHIGPYAEEFNDTFKVGGDDKRMINLVDAVGVLMGSVKELDAKVEARG